MLVGVGTITLDTNVNNGTNGAIVIVIIKMHQTLQEIQELDAEFYQVYDVRLLNAASPDGFNKAQH